MKMRNWRHLLQSGQLGGPAGFVGEKGEVVLVVLKRTGGFATGGPKTGKRPAFCDAKTTVGAGDDCHAPKRT